MHYEISLEVAKKLLFLLKKIIECGDETGIPEPVRDGDGFTFSSPLDMGRVTGKYTRIGYEDKEC